MGRLKILSRALLAGCCAVSALALTACGGGGGFAGNGGNASGKQTVTMLVNITPNLSEIFWRNLVAPYEKANNVTVKIQAPTGSGVSDSLPQLLAAGTAPDVVETLMVNKTLAPQMLDLTDQPWVKDTPLAQEASLGGKVYTVGVGEQAQSLVYYNQDAFTKAGMAAPPKNLDEFTADLGKLKAAGYLPLQTGGDYITGLQLLQLPTHPSWPATRTGTRTSRRARPTWARACCRCCSATSPG